ncbi:MAG: diacylglycerol kinase family protein [Candidatus Izemoplasmatales bacterium]|nr:diacylglycerol kinase family protein [Candidatus Izemoplasmatales bacterium]
MFLIIHNPLSNNKKSKKTTNKMVKFFKRHKLQFILRSTLKFDNLNEYLDNNPSITDILYLGGDGSINYLINNVDITKIKQNIHLAKSGSGNDFLRSLKRKGRANVTIGIAKTDAGDVKFINGCGAGFDASVCYYVNNDTKKNKMAYFKNVFKATTKFEPAEMDVVVDGVGKHYHDCFFTVVQNGKYFGGGMKVAPKANIDSTDFTICVIHDLNKLLLQVLFLSIYPGFHTNLHKWVTMLEGKEIQVKSSKSRFFQTDGEVLENVNEFSISHFCSREFIAFNKRNLLKSLKAK